MEQFGEFARLARERKRISLRTLATHLGLSATYVSDIERGLRNTPNETTTRAWASFIDVDPDQFLRMAELDRRTVEVRVNRDPKKAEIAMAFAREIDDLSSEQRDQIMKILVERKGAQSDAS